MDQKFTLGQITFGTCLKPPQCPEGSDINPSSTRIDTIGHRSDQPETHELTGCERLLQSDETSHSHGRSLLRDVTSTFLGVTMSTRVLAGRTAILNWAEKQSELIRSLFVLNGAFHVSSVHALQSLNQATNTETSELQRCSASSRWWRIQEARTEAKGWWLKNDELVPFPCYWENSNRPTLKVQRSSGTPSRQKQTSPYVS